MKINKSIDWVFFDVGGVLVDESVTTLWRQEHIAKVLTELGHPTSLEQVKNIWIEVSGIIGSLDLNSFKLFLKNEERATKAYEKFKEYRNLRAQYADLVTIKLEVIPTLDQLSKKYKLGIIGNQGTAIKEKLSEAGVLQFFNQHSVSQEHGFEKPDPKLFSSIFTETGADPNTSVMIDDNIERGLIPAKKFGMTTVWFKNGERETIPSEVDYTITTFPELENLLL